MKLAFNLYLFLLVFSTFVDKSFSLNDYQIKKICKNEKRVSICIKKLKENRSNLQEGNSIEIPVIPYRR